MMNWHNITKEEALKILESSQTEGLTKKVWIEHIRNEKEKEYSHKVL